MPHATDKPGSATCHRFLQVLLQPSKTISGSLPKWKQRVLLVMNNRCGCAPLEDETAHKHTQTPCVQCAQRVHTVFPVYFALVVQIMDAWALCRCRIVHFKACTRLASTLQPLMDLHP